ncbi:hypothetical protein XH98_09185 [Bradyrhizobium sp. CCBAU 51745]|uniref:hypothetical protein n=1 Tax=Bradyrhizobium sp. CCBAU 51745 TaxID=1325099 RepID=UPI0023050566|nr:hypothetical protein [Bradyrhizobium sp. CCBAU 51745]MDA9407183.1 hypothetical protein [Bradyrhizobium sp. CCBAU 45384]MDA9439285.1 hypothetical protein [Bradyrhizobium sp. CCBAU 51745]
MEIRLKPCRRKRQTVHHQLASLPKILKARDFVHIGEFHSAPKRASGGTGGMREAKAGGEGSLSARSLSACASSACSPATLAAEVLFEV